MKKEDPIVTPQTIDNREELLAALKRTHLERLLFFTRLYKIQKTMEKAIVKHKPYHPAKA